MMTYTAGQTYSIPISEIQNGQPVALTLTSATLTDSAGTVTAETVSGQTLVIAVPSNAALGAATINYDVNDGSGAVAATPIAVTIVAPPSAPVPGAQLVLVGGKYQLIQPNGVTFGASPTLTLTNASVGVVFGPAQVDNGSATDLPTWTLTGVAVGTYAAAVSIVIDGASRELGETVQVVTTLAPPALPTHMISLATLRTKLRTVVRDTPIVDPLDDTATLPTVFADLDLDDAVREALRVYSAYRRMEKPLPTLTFQPGVNVYPMPFDFLAPETKSWKPLLQDGWASGAYWGSRYGWMRYQAEVSAPYPSRGGNNGGLNGLGFWPFGGGLSATGLPPLAYDSDGEAEAFTIPGFGVNGGFNDADINNPTPTFVLNPAPSGANSYSSLRYYASHYIMRLNSSDGVTWDKNSDGTFSTTPTYDGQDAVDATDVLTVTALGRESDAARLILLYAKYWVLTQLVLVRADTDADQFAFYQTKTGMARGDIADQAQKALAEFEKRTRFVAYGTVG